MNVENKRKKEIKLMKFMIHIYCQHHNDIDELELLNYATIRIQKCPFMESKTFCSRCRIHCYEKDMQDKIKRVMRYSGKRMIFIHPILVMKHALKL